MCENVANCQIFGVLGRIQKKRNWSISTRFNFFWTSFVLLCGNRRQEFFGRKENVFMHFQCQLGSVGLYVLTD